MMVIGNRAGDVLLMLVDVSYCDPVVIVDQSLQPNQVV